MRALSLVAFLLIVIAACSSSTSSSGGGGSSGANGEGGAVDADYCEKYCAAEESSGTLVGSLADCLAACCKDVPTGCPTDQDAAMPDDDADTTADSGAQDSAVDAPQAQCTTGADCASGCCAPATNAAGDPIGPYLCKPNDGKMYDCCSGIGVNCTAPGCCVKDSNNNEFCAPACKANSECGAAHCVGYTFSVLATTCQGPLACGP